MSSGPAHPVLAPPPPPTATIATATTAIHPGHLEGENLNVNDESATSPKKGRGGGKDKSVSCAYCSMTFNKKEHLQRHERTHTLDRPYVCEFPECGKTFARRDTLTRHSRLHVREETNPDASAITPGASIPAPVPSRGAGKGLGLHPHHHPAVGSSSAAKKRKARHAPAGWSSAAKRAAGSASESEHMLISGNNSVGHSSSPAAFLSHSGGSGSSLDRMDEDDHDILKTDHLASPVSPITDDANDVKDVIEQPTPMGLTTATLLYGMAWGEHTHPPSSIVEPISSLAPTAADVALSTNNLGASSLGLDIPMPQHVFNNNIDISAQSPQPNVPAFVQAVQSGFKIFPAQGGEAQLDQSGHINNNNHQFPHQSFPAAGGQPPQQSFLAGGPVTSDAGSPYATQLFSQGGGGGGNADLTGFSRSFSPIERPTSSNSSASYLYSSAASEPSSLTSSVHSLAASLPPTSSFEGGDAYNPYYYDPALRAFKHNTAYMQALTMEHTFLDLAMRMQMELANGEKANSHELPVEDFLQWPSREHSPAVGSMGLSPESGWTNESNSPSAASSFFDFNDYDGTQATLFAADKTITTPQPPTNAHSPIASLEEWLLRQNNDGLYD